MKKLALTSDQIAKYGQEFFDFLLNKTDRLQMYTLTTNKWEIVEEEDKKDENSLFSFTLHAEYIGSSIDLQIQIGNMNLIILLANGIFDLNNNNTSINISTSLICQSFSKTVWFNCTEGIEVVKNRTYELACKLLSK